MWGGHLCVKVEVCGGQRTIFGGSFFPSMVWLLRVELRFSALATITFIFWAISLAQKGYFKYTESEELS